MGMDAKVYCKVDGDVNDARWRIAALSGMGIVNEATASRKPVDWAEWDDKLSIERDAITKQQTWIEWHTFMRYFSPHYQKGYWPTIRLVITSMMHVAGNAYYRSDSSSDPIGYWEQGYSSVLTPEQAITIGEIAQLDAAWAAYEASHP